MPTIRIELDTSSFNKLAEIAVEERRPIPWQAEVLLLKALGAWPASVEEAIPRQGTLPLDKIERLMQEGGLVGDEKADA